MNRLWKSNLSANCTRLSSSWTVAGRMSARLIWDLMAQRSGSTSASPVAFSTSPTTHDFDLESGGEDGRPICGYTIEDKHPCEYPTIETL